VDMEATLSPKSQLLFKNPCKIIAIYSANNTNNIRYFYTSNEHKSLWFNVLSVIPCGK
jgi:hypothetical protein